MRVKYVKLSQLTTDKFILVSHILVQSVALCEYEIWPLSETQKSELRVMSVSYTHLDVYKRQHVVCVHVTIQEKT